MENGSDIINLKHLEEKKVKVVLDVSEEALERAKEWKELADSLGLDQFEMYQLVYHIQEAKKLINKNK